MSTAIGGVRFDPRPVGIDGEEGAGALTLRIADPFKRSFEAIASRHALVSVGLDSGATAASLAECSNQHSHCWRSPPHP